MTRETLRTAAAGCGVASPLVAAVGIGAAMVVAPSFSFAADPLSKLGVTAGAAPWFNGGLLVAGALAVPFGWYCWTLATDPFRRAAAVLVAVAGVALAGVGAFPMDQETPHAAAAIGHYAAFTYALFCWGTGEVWTGAVRRGLTTVWLAVVHVSAWLVWGVALVPLGVTGLAAPETAGAAIFAAWVLTTVRRTRPRTR